MIGLNVVSLIADRQWSQVLDLIEKFPEDIGGHKMRPEDDEQSTHHHHQQQQLSPTRPPLPPSKAVSPSGSGLDFPSPPRPPSTSPPSATLVPFRLPTLSSSGVNIMQPPPPPPPRTRPFQKVNSSLENSPLYEACKNQAPLEVIQALIAANPEAVQTRGTDGSLPLHVACASGAMAGVITCLLEEYPDSATQKAANDMLPLHVAAKHALQDDSLLEVLTAYPDAANETESAHGYTPREIAAEYVEDDEQCETIFTLLEIAPVLLSATESVTRRLMGDFERKFQAQQAVIAELEAQRDVRLGGDRGSDSLPGPRVDYDEHMELVRECEALREALASQVAKTDEYKTKTRRLQESVSDSFTVATQLAHQTARANQLQVKLDERDTKSETLLVIKDAQIKALHERLSMLEARVLHQNQRGNDEQLQAKVLQLEAMLERKTKHLESIQSMASGLNSALLQLHMASADNVCKDDSFETPATSVAHSSGSENEYDAVSSDYSSSPMSSPQRSLSSSSSSSSSSPRSGLMRPPKVPKSLAFMQLSISEADGLQKISTMTNPAR